MKYLYFLGLLFLTMPGRAQNLQLHFDFRHTFDPKLNSKNFPTFNFEYFKNIDTINTGSFLFKVQTDLNGKNNNVNQFFTQISQSLKFWEPKIFLSLNYSGGLGITSGSNGFYLPNSFAAGISCPFQWKGAWFAPNLLFRYNAFDKPSYDPQVTFYFGKGLFKYKIFVAGSFTFWTENRNEGDDYTKNLSGKKFAFFGDPQIWIKIRNGFSIGSRINVYYHLLTNNNQIQFYPTLATRYQF